MFQLNQVRRRYRPAESQNTESTVLDLRIVPSDPDFPFELEALECRLTVPMSFPAEMPRIRVTNKEMGKGYQLNVEAGFYQIMRDRPQGTMLQWLNELDRRLEALLAKEKADTVKIVVPPAKKSERAQEPVAVDKGKAKMPEVSKPQAQPAEPAQPAQSAYGTQQLLDAKSKREMDTLQLECRLGRLPQYAKSDDGLVYTIPVEPRKRDELPSSIQSVKTLKLIVPQLYNLQPCRIELDGVTGHDAEILHEAFTARCTEMPNLSLVSHLNYLMQNMHTMAATTFVKKVEPIPAAVPEPNIAEDKSERRSTVPSATDDSRSHIVKIPRPPEWDVRDEASPSESDDSYASSLDEDNNSVESDVEATQPQGEGSDVQRGILVSFPHLEMHGIELMEVYSISLEVKCDRCKTQMDVMNVKNNAKVDSAGVRSESCRKCANAISIGYRMDLIHANSVKAGYVDLDGATIVDLLPSNFIPTCSQCSTASPQPGVSSVRGESTMAVCRRCHGKMTFRIPEVKFLRISAAAVRASRAPPRKKHKERLGLTVGEELPKRGRCKHYSKSMRWFRFSCCSKVFPCDRCHDEVADHPTEHANRMICGFCSREQNYRPEDCGFCHAVLTGRKGSGFWEGGKGKIYPFVFGLVCVPVSGKRSRSLPSRNIDNHDYYDHAHKAAYVSFKIARHTTIQTAS
ncbi:hypothetical protein, variant [Verruconis gallopava]|nr:hypothetical protein, variant [Verruconis gallopava]KIW04412.1 hypothetical protein, variant [Verruconis gallopava]